MSFNKIKSLKLQRHNESTIKLEDTSITLADETKSQTETMDKPLSQNRAKHQESLTPLHSTPKRSTTQSSGAHDSHDFGMSPMMLPCTQEVANEVAWDWQSPLTKSRATRRRINNGESISTPKRTNMLKKKRNSNSPLLYNPIKRKLLRNENQQESIEKFTAEMKALSEQIKTVPKENVLRVSEIVEKTTNETDDEMMIQIDIGDFSECEKKNVTTKMDAIREEKNVEVRRAGKTSMEDLFDDSIEDSMVKCSQEVEEKLRLESCRGDTTRTNSKGNGATVKDFSWHQQSYTSFLAPKEQSRLPARSPFSSGNNGSGTKTSSSSSLRTTTDSRRPSNATTSKTSTLSSSTIGNESKKSSNAMVSASTTSRSTNSTSSVNNKKLTSISSKSSTEKNPVSRENEMFAIPDDSFDDDFLDVCFDDDDETTIEKIDENVVEKNQATKRYGKVYESPHLPTTNDSRRNADTTSRRVLLPPPSSQSTKVGNTASKIFPRSTSNDSFGPSTSNSSRLGVQQSQITATTSTTTTNQARKFFKTKSLSTPSFDDGKAPNPNGKTYHEAKVNANPVSIAIQRQTIKAGNPRSNNAWESRNGGIDNHSGYVENFDRNERREDGNRLKISNDSAQQQQRNGSRETATGSQVTAKCTPEEIERKRMEAKMKLEAKRKMQARSKSASLLPGGATNLTKR